MEKGSSTVRVQVAEAVGEAENSTRKALSAPVISILDLMPADVWARLNRLMATTLPKESQVSQRMLMGGAIVLWQLHVQSIAPRLLYNTFRNLYTHTKEGSRSKIHTRNMTIG